MGFYGVSLVEPHSDVTPALLEGAVTTDEWVQSHIELALGLSNSTTVFFPDAGASKRYTSPIKYTVGMKTRDFKTGSITDYSLSGEWGEIVNERVLIVDDLCSRGGTFIEASKMLKSKGAKSVNLLVAHCENNVFSGKLFEHITYMYASKNNLMDRVHAQLTLI
jgi:ribose-phosphate pyrophosphokinase